MASSIKISDQTKHDLDKLLATLMIKYDKKFTQQEIIQLLIKLGTMNMELLLSPMKSPTDATIDNLKKLQKPWKMATDPDIIDEMLYGDSAE